MRHQPVVSIPLRAAVLITLAYSGCSAPAALPPPVAPAVVEARETDSYSKLVVDGKGWLRGDDVALPAERVVARARAGDRLALAFIRNDSTHLALVDLTEDRVQTAPLAPRAREVTLAWRGDYGALAIGFFLREGEAMGAGGLVVVDVASMDVRPSGCRTSTVVYGWAEEDRLVVGDGKTIVAVDAATCATRSSLSLLKKHEVAVSPTGRHVAYVLRELEYNREKRAYEPDSTLMVAAIDGSNERAVAGSRYHPRNLSWSPDGTKLAFDVTSQTDPALRHLAVYDVAAGEATFIVRATDAVLPSESRPVWSPDGAFMAYDRVFVHGELYQKAIRSLADNAIHLVAEQPMTSGKLEVWGWTSKSVVLRSSAGQYLIGTPGEPRPLPLDVEGELVLVF
ncbi:MAG: hypothetical protein SH809_06900 [Rhodothermales bacterium]|nr:hypothetical protein [Rhodothermales bacterium]